MILGGANTNVEEDMEEGSSSDQFSMLLISLIILISFSVKIRWGKY